MMTETKIDLFRPNDRNRLKTVLLGNVPTPADLKEVLGRPIPKIIEQLLIETHEDLETIKNKYKELGVEVIMYPVVGKKENFLEDTINVRNGFIVVDLNWNECPTLFKDKNNEDSMNEVRDSLSEAGLHL